MFTMMTQASTETDPPMVLWLGLSTASPTGAVPNTGAGERVSILTHGMESLDHPNLLVEGPKDNATLGFIYDLATYLVGQNAQIADGETVGDSPAQRIVVRHRPSPIDPNQTVLAIDLPPGYVGH
jgi:hypothetical protein